MSLDQALGPEGQHDGPDDLGRHTVLGAQLGGRRQLVARLQLAGLDPVPDLVGNALVERCSWNGGAPPVVVTVVVGSTMP